MSATRPPATPSVEGPDSHLAALMTLINGAWRAQVIHVAAELGLADCLAERPRSSGELAAEVHADPGALHRLLRAMASLDLCAEQPDGCFALRPRGECLKASNPQSVHAWALTWGRYLAPAWNHLLQTVRTGERVALGQGLDNYADLAADPTHAPLFNASMGALTARLIPALVAQYQPPVGSCLVDVGGGTGQILAGYLQADPTATGILFDQPPAIAAAESVLQTAGVAARCRRVAGDFFTGVPAGGDVYFLKSVLHDWDDAQALTILRHCAVAMQATSRLVIMERVSPAVLTPGPVQEATAAADLNLLVAFGGRVRQTPEFDQLLAAAGLRRIEERTVGWAFAILIAERADP